jgi:hypothetical protein
MCKHLDCIAVIRFRRHSRKSELVDWQNSGRLTVSTARLKDPSVNQQERVKQLNKFPIVTSAKDYSKALIKSGWEYDVTLLQRNLEASKPVSTGQHIPGILLFSLK